MIPRDCNAHEMALDKAGTTNGPILDSEVLGAQMGSDDAALSGKAHDPTHGRSALPARRARLPDSVP